MKNFLKVTAICWFASTLLGCSSEDENNAIFEGVDNHITSFALTTTDNVIYKAAIVENQIIVTIPQNVSLQGAQAEYTICEQTILYPDPAKIDDWDHEYRFRVMAYNETLCDYTYSVERTAVSSGSVTLLTQSDVKEYAATGATVIDGNLVIGDFSAENEDPITDLSPLSNVTDVRYNIVVNNSFAGEKLSGLDHLRSAGGLMFGSATTTLSTPQPFEILFPALETLGQLILNSATIKSLILPKLRVSGAIYIDALNLAQLDLRSLEECVGDLTAISGTNPTTANKSLRALLFPLLKKITGSLTLQYFDAATVLDLTKLTSIGGNCILTNLTAIKTLQLPELYHLGGAFEWSYLSSVSTFRAPKLVSAASFVISDNTGDNAVLAGIFLPALECVRGPFLIKANLSNDILSLPALKSVEGEFSLTSFPNLITLELPLLETCGSLSLSTLNLLPVLDISKVGELATVTITQCPKLATLKVGPAALHDVKLNANNKSSELVRFIGAESISGELTVDKYAESEISFPGIKTIGTYTQSAGKAGETVLSFPDLETLGSLKLTFCTWLKKLSAPHLTAVTDTWNTSRMQYIEEGDLEVPALRRIGTFKFWGGSNATMAKTMRLTGLSDFKNVTEIGTVDIKWWGKMVDFSGLKNALPSLSEPNWSVIECGYSPTWKNMADGKFTEQ